MVSVAVVSYNTREITRKCLLSLARSNSEIETLVWDNGSADGSAEMIESEFPWVKLVKSKTNLGFAKANNRLIEAASGELVLLLNSDAFVFEDTVGEMERFMESHPKCGCLGCKLMYKDGRLQFSWGYFPTVVRVWQLMLGWDGLPKIKNYLRSIHTRIPELYNDDLQVDWCTGACLMVRKEAFRRVGGIDEKYFMYGEEMEWQYRIKNQGFENWYTGKAECVHLEGASSGDRSAAVIGEMKGWIYWFNKHANPLALRLVVWAIICGCAIRVITKPSLAKAYRKAVREIIAEVFGQ